MIQTICKLNFNLCGFRCAGHAVAFLCCALFCACEGNFDKRLAEEAERYTAAHCPCRLDEITTLDSVVYTPATGRYTHYLHIPTTASTTIVENREAVRQQLLQGLKDDAAWKECKDHGVIFRYVYSSKVSELNKETQPVMREVLSFSFTPQDYE